MSVTVNVLSLDNNFAIIECINDGNGQKIMKTPILIKQRTKKSIEKQISDSVKAFKSPVWGGFNIVWYCKV